MVDEGFALLEKKEALAQKPKRETRKKKKRVILKFWGKASRDRFTEKTWGGVGKEIAPCRG